MSAPSLPGTLRRYAGKIADVDRDADGWIVGLARGWYCPENETHLITENTLAEVAGKLRGVVRCSPETCDMKDCGPRENKPK